MNLNSNIILTWILSTVIFAALIIYISKHPQKRTMPFKAAFIIMFIGGIIIYCTCHYLEIENVINGSIDNASLNWVKSPDASKAHIILYVVMMSVLDVGIMFYGRSNTDVFYNLPYSNEPVFVILFWLIHFIAFYTPASVLLIRFGNDLLRWIRIITSKISYVNLVFGINKDSISFGRNIAESKSCMLVYVDSVIKNDYDSLTGLRRHNVL